MGQMKKITDKKMNEMVNEHMYLVHYHAAVLIKRLPANVQLDDLVQAGSMGLMKAVELYDDTQEASFKTYAKIKIKGAMMDELREWDIVAKSYRQKIKQIYKIRTHLEERSGGRVSSKEISEASEFTVGEVCEAENISHTFTMHSYDENFEEEEDVKKYFPLKFNASVEEGLLEQEEQEIMNICIKRLPYQQRNIIKLVYYNGMSSRSVADSMGLDESRISQELTLARQNLTKLVSRCG